ncbi:MAG: CYTH domain-containing protein [Bacteroidales bacterium]|nr:CYTH domain-containing protein [Bacteroidales bacterium]
MEIERKFKVAQLPQNLAQYPHADIEQGYLCTSPTVRVRRIGDSYVLTVKEHLNASSSAIHNREEEFSLTAVAYADLIGKCDGRTVCKTRYYLPITTGLTAELDIFSGRHEGLQIVEVEFPNTMVADRFVPPSWFGPEVSSDPRYRNSWLAYNTL